jgi:hypothetical protein
MLIHQMRISIIYVFSNPQVEKKMEILNVITVKIPENPL